MLIKLLRNTVADGQMAGAGQVVTVTDATGRTLVQMGKAVEVNAAPHPASLPKGDGAAEVIAPAAPVVEKTPAPAHAVEEPVAIAPAKPKGRQGRK